MLLIFDLTFFIIDIEIPVMLPYISSCFITSKLYIRLILGTMTLLKTIITIIMAITMIIATIMIMISTTIFQNTNENLEKMT